MQREMKYRAWCPERKKMFDVSYIQFPRPDGSEVFEPSIGLLDWDKAVEIDGFMRSVNVMQFTGLKDKNGKEIYEGDVLLHHDKHYLVRWDENMAAFQTENVKDRIDSDFFNWGNVPSLQTLNTPTITEPFGANCEVIGNIYENPDLLKTV